MADFTPDEIREQVKEVLQEPGVSPDYLRLFQDIFEAQYHCQEKLPAGQLYPYVTKDEAARRLSKGLPVIDPARLQLEEAVLNDLFQKLCDIVAQHMNNGDLGIGRLSQAARQEEISLRELIESVLSSDETPSREFSKQTGVREEVIAFLAASLAVPFLRVCAKELHDCTDLDRALTGRCPICGGIPLMARLCREDGRRMLECSLCATQWRFQRIKCLHCGNEEQNTLSFFFVEEQAAYRVDRCEQCRGYIKTVDERKRSEGKSRALPIDDVATLSLDILAEREGYYNTSQLLKRGVRTNG